MMQAARVEFARIQKVRKQPSRSEARSWKGLLLNSLLTFHWCVSPFLLTAEKGHRKWCNKVAGKRSEY